jgi:hypothetical protein
MTPAINFLPVTTTPAIFEKVKCSNLILVGPGETDSLKKIRSQKYRVRFPLNLAAKLQQNLPTRMN